jgi:TorA maturation chaperone TorD
MQAADLLTLRALTYGFLARLSFAELDVETLEHLHSSGVLEDFPVQWESDARAELQQGLQLMARGLQLPQKTLLAVLAADFSHLFLGYSLACPPFESAYRNEEHLLLCEETLEVRHFYQQYGFRRQEALQLPDDHVAFELEFLALLGQAAHDAAATPAHVVDSLRASQQFLQEHVLAWVPEFAQDLFHNAETDFYRGVALFLRGFIQLDAEILAEVTPRMDTTVAR